MRNSSYKHFDGMEVVYYSHSDVLFVSKPHTLAPWQNIANRAIIGINWPHG